MVEISPFLQLLPCILKQSACIPYGKYLVRKLRKSELLSPNPDQTTFKIELDLISILVRINSLRGLDQDQTLID